MSSPCEPTPHSAALYDALEAVDAFIRTRLAAPADTGATPLPAPPAETRTPRRRAKRKTAPPSAPAADHGVELR
ncbi:hypothetical protein M2352_001620 [Azospirillum fermentarium]|uniref:hypothetical protein n=1 Tax=Azospirillum fermentarium TaxID=1233114 RepID=UPI00222775A1|nr:hypothetical protein [Azospirillum fermentarium]MCW2246029.1 hypothetical protein [Azospirillum fermentarium]